MKMQYLESLQAFVTTEIRIWDPSQTPINHLAKRRFLEHQVYGDSKDLYLVWSMDVHKTSDGAFALLALPLGQSFPLV